MTEKNPAITESTLQNIIMIIFLQKA